MAPDLPDDRELERSLRELAARPRSSSSDDELAWRVAANGDSDEAERQRLFADPETMSEFGVASALLEVRGRPHADAQRSTDAVLRRIGLVPVRSSWSIRSRLAVVAAAAAVVLLWAWWGVAPSFEWSSTEVVARVHRGATGDGLQFRVRLHPAADCWPAVFVVHGTSNGATVQRVHPLRPDLAGSASFANWPKGALPGGSDVVLPPSGIPPFQVASAPAFLLLVEGGAEPFAEPRLEHMERIVTGALGGIADGTAVATAANALMATGLVVRWQVVEPR